MLLIGYLTKLFQLLTLQNIELYDTYKLNINNMDRNSGGLCSGNVPQFIRIN
jgi:hypothetical protein